MPTHYLCSREDSRRQLSGQQPSHRLPYIIAKYVLLENRYFYLSIKLESYLPAFASSNFNSRFSPKINLPVCGIGLFKGACFDYSVEIG